MNIQVLKYLQDICIQTNKKQIIIPSIRWFSIKFGISQNDIVKTLSYLKENNIIISVQGSKNYLLKDGFLNLFKNDSMVWFGKNVQRKIVKKKIVKQGWVYKYFFEREFIKDQQIISISSDTIFLENKDEKIDIHKGVDKFIRENIPGKKIVNKKMAVINIEKMEEFKKLKFPFCVFVEVRIYNEFNREISHSFSLFPILFFKSHKLELIL